MILPLLTFAVTIALWILIMLLLTNAVLLATGMSVATLWPIARCSKCRWAALPPDGAFMGSGMRPSMAGCCWFPAWARRAAFLWAILPPFAIGIVEKIAFNTSYFASMLGYRFGGGAEDSNSKATGLAVLLMPHFTSDQLLFNPSLWTGLAVTTIFLAVAVRLRRNREPI